jgi:hypothetical protein
LRTPGLSAIGGTIRVGELAPNSKDIAHALKFEFFGAAWYYGARQLQPATKTNKGRTQYYWPATGSDDDSVARNGKPPGYNGSYPSVAPGALLALPPRVASGLTVHHPIARKFRNALMNYGAYLVDSSSGYANKVSICMAQGVNTELQSHYNISMAFPHGIEPTGHGAQLYTELLLLLRNLHTVTNNSPNSVGGGGAPLVPRAPPICGAANSVDSS